jgi:uncharacterized protein YciI
MTKTKSMKNLILMSVLALIASATIMAQQKEEPAPKMVQFHMALLSKGPKWDGTAEQQRKQILKQHFANLMLLLSSGKAVIAGPMGDGTTPAGIFILRAASAEEAKGWIDADPAVQAGLFAGPFGDDGALRGIFVFRVGSLQEAQDLCATDPMIKIGRLAVELHPWRVPEGVLP